MFNFVGNIQSWAKQELRCHYVQDLTMTMVVVKSLVEHEEGLLQAKAMKG